MLLSLDTTHFRESRTSRGDTAAESCETILETAVKCGVRCFDTAGAYDEAERILGNFIDQYEEGSFRITAKIRPNVLYSVAPDEYQPKLERDLLGSLRNLRLSRVDACLFHNADYLEDPDALKALYALKLAGLTSKVGICVQDPDQFATASASPYLDVIQISYNVLDTRMDRLLEKTGKEIQARGAFLNGLLLCDENEVPQDLWEVKPYLHTLAAYCERYGVSMCELALTFVKTQTKISQLILRVEDAAQLREDCACFARSGDEVSLRELPDQLGGLDERIIMPSLWRGEMG